MWTLIRHKCKTNTWSRMKHLVSHWCMGWTWEERRPGKKKPTNIDQDSVKDAASLKGSIDFVGPLRARSPPTWSQQSPTVQWMDQSSSDHGTRVWYVQDTSLPEHDLQVQVECSLILGLPHNSPWVSDSLALLHPVTPPPSFSHPLPIGLCPVLHDMMVVLKTPLVYSFQPSSFPLWVNNPITASKQVGSPRSMVFQPSWCKNDSLVPPSPQKHESWVMKS